MINVVDEESGFKLSRGSTASLSETSVSTTSSREECSQVDEQSRKMSLDYESDRIMFHELMSAYGYNFPANIISHFFQCIKANSGGSPSLRNDSRSFDEYFQYYSNWKTNVTNINYNAMFYLALDGDAWCAFIYIIAGMLLIIGIFLKQFITIEGQRNIFLIVSLSYGSCSGRYLMKSVLCKWYQSYSIDDLICKIQSAFIMKADERSLWTLQRDHETICYAYSEFVIGRYGRNGSLSQIQLNRLIVEDAEILVTFEELNHVFTLLDFKKDGKITSDEFFLFLTHARTNVSASGRIRNIFLKVLSDRIWMSTFFFLLGSSLSACNNILKRLNDVGITFGRVSPSFFTSSCFVLGTLGFTLHDFYHQYILYCAREKVKMVLLCWFKTAKYYEKDTNCKMLSNSKGLTIKNLRLLLDDSTLYLSDQWFFEIIGTITTAKDDHLITEADIIDFIDTQSSMLLNVCFGCFTNVMFLANFIWFLGAAGFLLSSYAEENTLWFGIGERVSELSIVNTLAVFCSKSNFA